MSVVVQNILLKELKKQYLSRFVCPRNLIFLEVIADGELINGIGTYLNVTRAKLLITKMRISRH